MSTTEAQTQAHQRRAAPPAPRQTEQQAPGEKDREIPGHPHACLGSGFPACAPRLSLVGLALPALLSNWHCILDPSSSLSTSTLFRFARSGVQRTSSQFSSWPAPSSLSSRASTTNLDFDPNLALARVPLSHGRHRRRYPH